MELVENIMIGGTLGAIILRASFTHEGIQFFTPDSFSQQLAFMKHPAGKTIQAHLHNALRREVFLTNEVLFIKRGRVKVDFYTDSRDYVTSRTLETGDVILLAHGGHGFEFLEETEMIEVKQGPYAGEADKTRFSPNRSDVGKG
jgi:hypothetical protein